MRKTFSFIAILSSLIIIGSCKKECNSNAYTTQPFIEKFGSFSCGGNLYEYEYIYRRKSQIDSLSECTFSPPVAFPVYEKEMGMVYIMVGKTFEYYGDTFQTTLWKDTCAKKVIYEVNRVQRDTVKYCCPYGVTAVTSMFCSVENVPEDYEVKVKYKYVPLE